MRIIGQLVEALFLYISLLNKDIRDITAEDLEGLEISSREYLYLIGLPYNKELTLSEFEDLGTQYWNYPLEELEHCIENHLTVLLVEFKGGELRWCDV